MGKQCPRCYTPVQVGQEFCAICGCNLSSLDYTQKINEYQPQKSKHLYLIIPLLLLFVGSVIMFAAYQKGYVLDRKLPIVTITSPSDTELTMSPGETIKEVIKIEAQDNSAIKKVELLENGIVIHSAEGQNATQYEWKTSEPSKYVLQAIAYDRCGNVNKSLPLVIIVKEEPTEEVTTIEVPTTPKTYKPSHSNNSSSAQMEIIEVLNTWVYSACNKDLNLHLDCYADYLEIYFTKHNVTKSDIYPGKKEAFTKYEVFDIAIYDVELTLLDSSHAVAIFNKKWDAWGAETFSGEEKQRLKFTNINGNWKITSEEELEIYWVITNGKRIV